MSAGSKRHCGKPGKECDDVESICQTYSQENNIGFFAKYPDCETSLETAMLELPLCLGIFWGLKSRYGMWSQSSTSRPRNAI